MESMKRYDEEFKKGVIGKYLEGRSVAALARETGVSEGVIHKWKNALVVKGDGEADEEKLLMRKKIRELEMEVEILKKAALIFGRPG
jgi:transposase-like protein